ncbi:MAG: type III pantothenate kinase [Gammaproteobacteria bacterium]
MNLLFDIGNTRIKAAAQGKHGLDALPSISSQRNLPFPPEWEAYPPESIYLASVASDDVVERINDWAWERWQLRVTVIEVQQDVAGIHTRYGEPKKLGVDRWLAALGAYHDAGRTGVCVIDAGTALTVDVVDDSGVHHGGLIAPGLELMIRSLTHNTAQLKLENISFPDIFAIDTEAAISLGCADYVAGMMERAGRRINKQALNIERWYVTGGQGELVMSLAEKELGLEMKNVPDLVLHGIAIAVENQS